MKKDKIMSERKAVYYGEVKIISGISCDGYVLDDNTSVLSERGAADLLCVDHKFLKNVGTNWPPKSLESFVDKGLNVGTNLVKIVAKNSHNNGKMVVLYK